jgi:membrane protein implicated in regulation of membrane protease activity
MTGGETMTFLLTLLTLMALPLLLIIFLSGGWGGAAIMWMVVAFVMLKIWRRCFTRSEEGSDIDPK